MAECDERFVQGTDGTWVKLDMNLQDVHFVCQEGHEVLVGENVVDDLLAIANGGGSQVNIKFSEISSRLESISALLQTQSESQLRATSQKLDTISALLRP